MDEKTRSQLKTLAARVLFDEPLDRHTSMGVGGGADCVVFPRRAEELSRAVSFLGQGGIPWVVMGNGTNLIVREGGYRGVVISLKDLKDIRIRKERDGSTSIEAEAGVALWDVVNLALREGLAGLEFCAGIPGTVGGALRMNAGAFGGEIKDVVRTVTLLAKTGETVCLERECLDFRYRSLDLPPDSVIVAVALRLKGGEVEEIRRRIGENMAWRRERHPLEHRSAGSIFRNPPGMIAGRLIEESGLKGLRIGDAQVSEKHGNFIVNLGQARAGDILALIDLIRERVQECKGVFLETEVKIIGQDR